MPKYNRKISKKNYKKKGNKKTYKKGGGNILDIFGFKTKEDLQNQPTEKKSSFFDMFKTDPTKTIEKLQKEKEKCITDIDAKIEKIKEEEGLQEI